MLPAGWPDTDRKIKILDFGIARTMTSDYRARRTSQGLGAARYVAPEQSTPPYEVDLRADIYSTGVLLFELLTGENSIGFELPSSFLSPQYQPFDKVVKTAVANRPDNRFPDAATMLIWVNAAIDAGEQILREKEKAAQRKQEKTENRTLHQAEQQPFADDRRREEKQERKQSKAQQQPMEDIPVFPVREDKPSARSEQQARKEKNQHFLGSA